jgi:hypothetical protein
VPAPTSHPPSSPVVLLLNVEPQPDMFKIMSEPWKELMESEGFVAPAAPKGPSEANATLQKELQAALDLANLQPPVANASNDK